MGVVAARPGTAFAASGTPRGHRPSALGVPILDLRQHHPSAKLDESFRVAPSLGGQQPIGHCCRSSETVWMSRIRISCVPEDIVSPRVVRPSVAALASRGRVTANSQDARPTRSKAGRMCRGPNVRIPSISYLKVRLQACTRSPSGSTRLPVDIRGRPGRPVSRRRILRVGEWPTSPRTIAKATAHRFRLPDQTLGSQYRLQLRPVENPCRARRFERGTARRT